jgi:hypothetical protein
MIFDGRSRTNHTRRCLPVKWGGKMFTRSLFCAPSRPKTWRTRSKASLSGSGSSAQHKLLRSEPGSRWRPQDRFWLRRPGLHRSRPSAGPEVSLRARQRLVPLVRTGKSGGRSVHRRCCRSARAARGPSRRAPPIPIGHSPTRLTRGGAGQHALGACALSAGASDRAAHRWPRRAAAEREAAACSALDGARGETVDQMALQEGEKHRHRYRA